MLHGTHVFYGRPINYRKIKEPMYIVPPSKWHICSTPVDMSMSRNIIDYYGTDDAGIYIAI